MDVWILKKQQPHHCYSYVHFLLILVTSVRYLLGILSTPFEYFTPYLVTYFAYDIFVGLCKGRFLHIEMEIVVDYTAMMSIPTVTWKLKISYNCRLGSKNDFIINHQLLRRSCPSLQNQEFSPGTRILFVWIGHISLNWNDIVSAWLIYFLNSHDSKYFIEWLFQIARFQSVRVISYNLR